MPKGLTKEERIAKARKRMASTQEFEKQTKDINKPIKQQEREVATARRMFIEKPTDANWDLYGSLVESFEQATGKSDTIDFSPEEDAIIDKRKRELEIGETTGDLSGLEKVGKELDLLEQKVSTKEVVDPEIFVNGLETNRKAINNAQRTLALFDEPDEEQILLDVMSRGVVGERLTAEEQSFLDRLEDQADIIADGNNKTPQEISRGDWALMKNQNLGEVLRNKQLLDEIDEIKIPTRKLVNNPAQNNFGNSIGVNASSKEFNLTLQEQQELDDLEAMMNMGNEVELDLLPDDHDRALPDDIKNPFNNRGMIDDQPNLYRQRPVFRPQQIEPVAEPILGYDHFVDEANEMEVPLVQERYVGVAPNEVFQGIDEDDEDIMRGVRADNQNVREVVNEIDVLSGGDRATLFDTLDLANQALRTSSNLWSNIQGDPAAGITRGKMAANVVEVNVDDLELEKADEFDDEELDIDLFGNRAPIRRNYGRKLRMAQKQEKGAKGELGAGGIMDELTRGAKLNKDKSGKWYNKDESLDDPDGLEDIMGDNLTTQVLGKQFKVDKQQHIKNGQSIGRQRIGRGNMDANRPIDKNVKIPYTQPSRRHRGNAINLVRNDYQTTEAMNTMFNP